MKLNEALTFADEFGDPGDDRTEQAAVILADEVRRLQAKVFALELVERNKHQQTVDLRAEVTALRLYAPARRAQPTVKTAPIGPCDHAYWRLAHETDAEFAAWGNEYTEVAQ